MTSRPLPLLTMLLALTCGPGGTEPAENESTGTEEPADIEPDEATNGDTPAATELPATFSPGQGETAFGVYWGPVTEGGTVSVQGVMAELETRGVSKRSAETERRTSAVSPRSRHGIAT